MACGNATTGFDFEQWLTQGNSGWKSKYQRPRASKSRPHTAKLRHTRSDCSSLHTYQTQQSAQSSPNTSFSSSFLDLKPQSPVITISTTPAPVVDGPPDWEVNFSLMAFAKFDPKITTEYFEVRESAKGGLGAFAIKDIEEGTVLLEELPLFKGDFGNIYDEYQKFTEKQTAEYLSLHAWKGSSRGDTETITCIFATNRFRLTEFDDGIFLKCSRFNHSCHPYASCTYNYNEETDKLKISALRDISIGEEITISYSRDPSSLYENYGFHCDCFGCQQLPLPPPEATTNDLELNTGGSRVYIEW